jgi:hypothetical protein
MCTQQNAVRFNAFLTAFSIISRLNSFLTISSKNYYSLTIRDSYAFTTPTSPASSTSTILDSCIVTIVCAHYTLYREMLTVLICFM